MSEANSSMRLLVALLVMCNDVMTNKQKPSKLADVGRMCWDVVLAIEWQSGVFAAYFRGRYPWQRQ